MRRIFDVEDSERGATMLEYALTAALIALVCISSISVVGAGSSNVFFAASGSMADAKPVAMGSGGK